VRLITGFRAPEQNLERVRTIKNRPLEAWMIDAEMRGNEILTSVRNLARKDWLGMKSSHP
jgi:hypothetical protein